VVSPKKPKGVTIMCKHMRSCRCLVLSLFLVVICASVARAQTALTTLPGKQGGTIVYGPVSGATTPAMAMARILRNVQNGVGEKPQVGKVFRVRGSNSDAVFFTVTNHAGGNVPVAGMLIASQTGPKAVEAAMVSDAAARFGSTMNPLLRQLFGVWHPGGTPGAGPASAPAGARATLPPMRQVTLPDGTATLSLPAGWNVAPNQSAMGMTNITGPQGEMLGLNLYYLVWDPYNPGVQNRLRRGIRFRNEIDYPTNADLTQSFADILQRIRAQAGQGPAPLKLASVQPASGTQGQCVTATGQLNPDGTTMRDMTALLCRSTPNQNGLYFFIYTKCLLPLGATDQQRATALAIMAGYKADMQRAQAIADAQTAPMIAAMQQTYQVHQQALMSFTQQQIARTRQIGADATARYNATQAANDEQHARWRQGEDDVSRNGQGFSNYILDQTVIQDNNMYGNGTIGHGTLWNSEADALVKYDPNRFEYVPTPNYWRGTDYVP